MSDAPQQPQLRLKPRLKSEAESPQPQPAPAPAAAEEAAKQSAPAPLAFKLRAPTPPPTADVPAPPALIPPPAIVPPAALQGPAPESATTEPPPLPDPSSLPAGESPSRLKLRNKDSEPPQAPASPPPTPEPAAPEDDKNAEGAAPRKTFKLTAKPPVTAHAHPEGVPPAFLVETPISVEAPKPPEPPRQAPEPITTAPYPETQAASSAPSVPKLGAPLSPPTTATPPPPPDFKARPKVPHFKPSEKLNLQAGKTPGIDAPLPKKGDKRPKLLLALCALCALGVGGYFAYDTFISPAPPPPAPTPAPAQKAPSTPEAPAKASGTATATPLPPNAPAAQKQTAEDNSIAHIPAKLISKAQDSLAARRNIEQERIDNPGFGKDSPDQRGFPLSPPPGNAPAAQEEPGSANSPTTYSNIAPGIAATDSSIKTTGKPASNFRRTVSEFTIRGVFQGNPARAHINGRIVIAGSLVDKNLGIIFAGVNADEKMLVFRDGSGATVMRRY